MDCPIRSTKIIAFIAFCLAITKLQSKVWLLRYEKGFISILKEPSILFNSNTIQKVF